MLKMSRFDLARQELSGKFVPKLTSLLGLLEAGLPDLYLLNFTLGLVTVSSSAAGTNVGSGGGGKYIMSLVKLSFYDHFMVVRGPSMLSTYRCAFLTAALRARADSSRISSIIHIGKTL